MENNGPIPPLEENIRTNNGLEMKSEYSAEATPNHESQTLPRKLSLKKGDQPLARTEDSSDPAIHPNAPDVNLSEKIHGAPSDSGLPSEDGLSPEQRFLGPPFSLVHEIAFVFTMCLSNILTQAGLSQTVVPLNIIGQGLDVQDSGQLSWFVAAYSLTVGTFILIAGRLGDIFGHKTIFITGFFWFGIWSMITGGIGPAMLVPNSLALLGRTYPSGRRKEMIFSIYGATAPNGFILGAVFGALLAQLAWWPWIYWCMAIACCLFGTLSIFVIPSSPRDSEQNTSFDYLGSLTGVGGLVLFNVAWNEAPVKGWNSPTTIVLLILGILLLALFVVIERKVAQPLVPLDTLSGKPGFVLVCIALGWSSFGIWSYYFLRFIANLRHNSPLSAAAQFTPAGISGLIAALTTGYMLSRVRTSLVMVSAMAAFCVGNILLGTMPVDQTYWIQSFLTLVITPWGMDQSFPAATIILSDFVPKEHQGIAASLVVTIVNYSISLGLGIAGTVEVHVSNGGQDLLGGYRGASYAGIGLSGLGFLFAMTYAILEERTIRKQPKKENSRME